MATTATFKYVDPASYDPSATAPFIKPWAKVDGPGYSFRLADHSRSVHSIPRDGHDHTTDTAGFSLHASLSSTRSFDDDEVIRGPYYAEVEAILRQHLPDGANVSKVVIFDHTIRKHDPSSARQPVQQVHVDQTPRAAEARVRRHVPADEADALLKKRYQIVNVWRPIGHPATDFPLAVVDWRSTRPDDFVKVDLLYPLNPENTDGQLKDDRGREVLPDPNSADSTDGYEVRGETFGVRPSDTHRFYYAKDMTPGEILFLKCFDSHSQIHGGKEGLADCAPHTAFIDPATPEGTPGRQSIEVRCLVFYK